MIRRPPRSTLDRSSAASDVYKRQKLNRENNIVVLNVASDFSPAALNKYLHDNNIAVSHLNARKKRLEEQFLELTAE